jgi:hypothetical protein
MHCHVFLSLLGSQLLCYSLSGMSFTVPLWVLLDTILFSQEQSGESCQVVLLGA